MFLFQRSRISRLFRRSAVAGAAVALLAGTTQPAPAAAAPAAAVPAPPSVTMPAAQIVTGSADITIRGTALAGASVVVFLDMDRDGRCTMGAVPGPINKVAPDVSRSSRRHSPSDFGFGTLFAAMRDALVVAEAGSGEVMLWNPAAEHLFGFTEAEMVGRSLDALVPERLRSAHHAGMARVAATGHGALVDSGLPVQIHAQRRDGSEFVIELSLTLIENAPVTGRFVCATIRDVTERVRLGEEARVARLNGAILVARSVAHEINNALSPLLGYAELLSLQPEVARNPVAVQYARLLVEGGQAIAERVKHLQSIVRLKEMSSPLGTDESVLDLKGSATPSGTPE